MKIESGPTIILEFEGDKVSADTQKPVRKLWSRGVSDTQRQREALGEIRRGLAEQGYLTAETTCRVSLSRNTKRVTFHVEKGPPFRQIALAFEGVEAFDQQWLRRRLDEADLLSTLYLDARKTTDFVVGLYRQRGYLEAKTEPPQFSYDERSSEAKVLLEISEGPLFRVGEIQFQGNRVIDEQTLRGALGIKSEDVYYPGIRGEAVARLEDLYLSKGYNRSEISDTAQLASNHRVDLTFPIIENVQDIVTEVEISGQQRVSSDFIKRQMGIEAGEILNLEKVSRARKSLYDTGAFSLVEIEPAEIEKCDGSSEVERPMRLQVRVRESVPHTINYGAFYDTDRGLGVTGDYRNHNLLRNGRVLGVRGRYDADRRELRGYFSQPARRWFPLRTHAAAFAAKEFRPSFDFDQFGFSIEQQAELKDTLIGSFGFSFVRNRVRERESDSMLEGVPLNVGALNTALAWDTRDSFLDATRGHFLTNAFQFAPTQFGSDLPFVKYFGSYSRYFPLTKPAKIPFGGSLEQSRLIFATGLRVGLAKGFDQDIISPTERFFAGGGTTIRGFKQDTVGPINEEGVPVGGNSLFIWNNELRFPLFSILEGVGFLDIGNVYPTVADFDPLDVRKAAGFGLRFRTPFFLVRVDYGFKLDRRPGESRGALFFSIGQAF
jgi:outer membrane protein assembly complex protein YaeT